MTVNFGKPSEKQKLFFLDRHKYIGFGGARGGGKSWAVRVKASLLCLKYHGISVCIVRKTYPELVSNHISYLRPLLFGIARYNDRDKAFTFPSGSKISLRYCSCDRDLDRFQGQQYDVIFIDEATQLTEEMFIKLTACVRGVNSFPKRVYLTFNPGGVGHGYVKRLFIDRRYREGEDPNDYGFIKSLVTDNTALLQSDPDYVKQLEALPPKLRRAWLEGDFNVLEGQYFEEFREEPDLSAVKKTGFSSEALKKQRRYCHVIDPFEIPADWKVIRSFDWGYAKPFSCDWWAVDFEGRAYLILQMYGCTGAPNEGVKWNCDKVFAEIAKTEKQHRWLRNRRISGVADSAIWAEDGGEAIIESADRHHVFFQKADKQRVAGWMQCHRRLAFDEEGKPMVYFFSTCKDAIRTLPLLRYDPTRAEDLDSTGEDHFADSFRYFCMSRTI